MIYNYEAQQINDVFYVEFLRVKNGNIVLHTTRSGIYADELTDCIHDVLF